MQALFFLFLAILWLGILALGLGSLPRLGPLLEVRAGIWEHKSTPLQSQELPGLESPVVITIDQYGVPHFFADSERDLYRAQGFMTASQRLFQMDVSTRQTAGRLSEMFGGRAQAFDDFFVKFGMRESVERTFQEYTKDAATKELLEAYTAGINTYIERLPQLPPEYKVLGVKPEPFDVRRVLHMGKALTWSLSGRSFDPHLTRYLQKLGPEKVLDLFPEYLPEKLEDFVFPERLGRPHAPETAAQFSFVSALKEIPHFPLPNPGKGSNNWIVGPSKSATGKSLLANDTHLTLTLPSTWYESQLSCPEFNVYGVSLVAVPGIVNGFNKDIAWGPTNGTTDVLDFFEIEFENETSFRYQWNGGWEQASVRRELIRSKLFGSRAVEVIETKLGMVLHREGKLGLVADWTGHRPGQELRALRGQYTARSAEECLKSFSKHWLVPIQNFVCADRQNIGWIHAGFVPLRKSGDGRFVMDGRLRVSPLIQAIPEVPQSFNPTQGFLQSANQKIVPPDYPHYFGWDYEPPFRGMTIRRRLQQEAKLSAQDMMDLQNENLDLQAEAALPLLLHHLAGRELSGQAREWVSRLAQWDFRIRTDQPEAVVFKAWWKALKEELFDDDLGEEAKRLYPKDMRVVWLLARLKEDAGDSDALWADNLSTEDRVETLSEVIEAALHKALKEIAKDLGPDNWKWTDWNKVSFTHAARLPGFGSAVLPMDGSMESVRGQGSRHGAVYKIVVETGEWPKAWIQVPGGNEGDPFSADFERFVGPWAKGEMRPVEFYRDRKEAEARAVRVIHLTPAGRN